MRLAVVCLMVSLGWHSGLGADEKSRKREGKAEVLVGCVDQAPGPRYMLLEPGSTKHLAWLDSDAPPDDMFARFLGHKVRVTGKRSGENFKVRNVQRISEECLPGPVS